MKYETLNSQIIELVGGKENIDNAVHCTTRLRIKLNDRSVAKTEEIKKLDGVIDVVSNETAYQVVIGTHVADVYDEFMSILGLSETNATSEAKPKSIKDFFNSIIVVISESMSSIVDVLLAAGLLASILAVLAMTGLVSPESSTYRIFETIKDAIFQFLPVFIAASSAKRLKVNPYIAIALAVTLLSPTIDGALGLNLFGFDLQPIVYSNTFIPILLAVWFLGVVGQALRKILPQSLHYFLVPVFSLMIALPITLFFFGPIGVWIGDGLTTVCLYLMNTFGAWIVVALYAAFQPFLIVVGAGNFMMPLAVNFLNTMGYDPIFLAAATISDIAVSGTMFGYFLKVKDTKEKQFFGTASFSALMGITEPAVFGAYVKYRKPFFVTMIGGGIGGLIAGFAGVKTLAVAWGLAGLPTYLSGGNTANFIFMVISVVVGFIVSAMVAYFVGLPQKKENKPTKDTTDVNKAVNQLATQINLGNVAQGTRIPIAEVSDAAFASEALGKGIGIIPNQSVVDIHAPVDGDVTVVFPTKHAYGIQTADGIEILIHIGVDTVNLDGEGFESLVEQGQTVKKGDLLARVNTDIIKDKGLDAVIMVVITNSNDYLDVIPNLKSENNELMTVVL